MPRLALIPPWLSGAMSQTCPFFSVPRYLCFYHLDRGVWRTAGSHSLDEPPLQFRPRPGAEGSQEEPPPPPPSATRTRRVAGQTPASPTKGLRASQRRPARSPTTGRRGKEACVGQEEGQEGSRPPVRRTPASQVPGYAERNESTVWLAQQKPFG